jgi:predicted Rossmann-fold nucleotide-binding protein
MTREEVAAVLDSGRLYSAGRDRLRTTSCTPPSTSSDASRPTRDTRPSTSTAPKLFQNSVREEGLLSIADGGVAYFQGSFGTLQEIFQDLAQNGAAAPAHQAAMIFVDTAAYGPPGSPFHLARARAARAPAPFDDIVTLADSADEVVAAVTAARGRRLAHAGGP